MNQQTMFETEPASAKPKAGSLVIGSQQRKALSKAQHTFNKLTKQVEKLRNEIESKTKDLDEGIAYYGREIHPVELQLAAVNRQFVKLLHRFYSDRKMLSKKEKRTLREVIQEQMSRIFTMDNTPPDEEMKIIFRDIEGMDYDKAMEDDFEDIREDAEAMFQSMGMDVDMSDVNMETFEEDLARKAKEFEEKAKSQWEEQQQRRANRRKTAKQLEKEAKEKQKEEIRQRSVSVIYKQLVKALHPDLERDEMLKMEKEALMKEAVAAYEKNDLHQLLRLEMLWLNKESDHLDSLTDEKLEIYNQLLKEQVNELKMQRDMVMMHPKYQKLLRNPFKIPIMKTTVGALAVKKQDLERTIAAMEESIRRLNGSNPSAELEAIMQAYIDLSRSFDFGKV